MTAPIYVVSSGGGVAQVFAHRQDAETFASDDPDARISRHVVRQSMDEAVVFFDRRVVVARGTTVIDVTHVVRQFVDDPLDAPDAADVEWFLDDTDSGWHIAGFGIDEEVLDVEVRSVIDRVRRLGLEAPMVSVGGRAS